MITALKVSSYTAEGRNLFRVTGVYTPYNASRIQFHQSSRSVRGKWRCGGFGLETEEQAVHITTSAPVAHNLGMVHFYAPSRLSPYPPVL